jgi:AcrR family transcriptional regulator
VGADQRRRLLEALPRAVAGKGIETTTVEDIVKLARVRRNAFYEQFEDKQDCFRVAYELAQERFLGVITLRCYTRPGLTDRLRAALGAGLALLAEHPCVAHLLAVEAPAAGGEMAARHHEWLDRYGRMLSMATIGCERWASPSRMVQVAVVGGIASRIKQRVLAGEATALPELEDELVEFALSFYAAREELSEDELGDREAPPQPQSPSRVLEAA